MNFADFAHIPWEDTPNFPKERNSQTETVDEISGGPSSRGKNVGEILE